VSSHDAVAPVLCPLEVVAARRDHPSDLADGDWDRLHSPRASMPEVWMLLHIWGVDD